MGTRMRHLYLPIHLSTYPPFHLSIYPSFHLSIYPSIHLSIHSSTYRRRKAEAKEAADAGDDAVKQTRVQKMLSRAKQRPH